MKKPKPVHYVNNRQMYETMCVYIAAVRKAEEEGTEKPRVPEYIGECFTLICNKLSMKPQFSGYSWRDEMISDGITNCIMAVDNFDPKFENPFAYFTMIAWNAFIRRIQREKTQTYIKHKNMQNSFIMDDLLSEFGVDQKGDYKSDDVIRDFEEKAEANKKKKTAKKKKGIELFI